MNRFKKNKKSPIEDMLKNAPQHFQIDRKGGFCYQSRGRNPSRMRKNFHPTRFFLGARIGQGLTNPSILVSIFRANGQGVGQGLVSGALKNQDVGIGLVSSYHPILFFQDGPAKFARIQDSGYGLSQLFCQGLGQDQVWRICARGQDRIKANDFCQGLGQDQV